MDIMAIDPANLSPSPPASGSPVVPTEELRAQYQGVAVAAPPAPPLPDAATPEPAPEVG